MGQEFSNLKQILIGNKMDRNIYDSIDISVVNDIISIDAESNSNFDDNNISMKNTSKITNTDCESREVVEQLNNVVNTEKLTNEFEKSGLLNSVINIEIPRKYKFSRKKLQNATKDRNKKKRNNWVSKFNCSRFKRGACSNTSSIATEKSQLSNACVCTAFRKVDSLVSNDDLVNDDHTLVSLLGRPEEDEEESDYSEGLNNNNQKMNHEDFPVEDCDELARLERAKEIAEGVEPPPGFSAQILEVLCNTEVISVDNLTAIFRNALSLSALNSQKETPRPIHTQIDYINCLVPDLREITACSFYWGKMDRYEAERLLENKPEGTFLLRDSAQEEYLFSVSFRKYGRSLHARIEQWNHKFSFDSHDPGVFASPTVCGLIEHYKDPTCCMFFEPMLTIPLHRNFPFSLQQLARASAYSRLNYDTINAIKLPKAVKTYLKEYHYRQRVRIRKFDMEQ